jgi:hypothetical protein
LIDILLLSAVYFGSNSEGLSTVQEKKFKKMCFEKKGYFVFLILLEVEYVQLQSCYFSGLEGTI